MAQEHVNIPHEVDKELMRASKKGGIDTLFKVRAGYTSLN